MVARQTSPVRVVADAAAEGETANPDAETGAAGEEERTVLQGREVVAVERRAARQARSRPIIEAFEPWLRARLETITQKGKLAEAIRYAWELITGSADDGYLGFDPNTIWVTVLHSDDEAAALWASIAGLPPERITIKLGDTKLPKAPTQGGSWKTARIGTAIFGAAQEAEKKLLAVAKRDAKSPLAEVIEDDVEIDDGTLR